LSFMYPDLAGSHATHGLGPDTITAFMQFISRILQAIYTSRYYLGDHLVQALKLRAKLGVLVTQY